MIGAPSLLGRSGGDQSVMTAAAKLGMHYSLIMLKCNVLMHVGNDNVFVWGCKLYVQLVTIIPHLKTDWSIGTVTIGIVQSEFIVRDPIYQSKIGIYAVIKVTN